MKTVASLLLRASDEVRYEFPVLGITFGAKLSRSGDIFGDTS